MSPSLCYAVNMYQKLKDQITFYDRFLATLSAHLTSSVPAKLCGFFHVSEDQKDSIISSQNPGLSLLLVLDEMGIIKSSEVASLEKPFNKFKLVQALARIDEYKEIVKQENRQLPQTTPHTLEDKRALFVEFVKKKIKSWYETMTPVPWKKSCQWKSTDLFVGSGLILTDSKPQRTVQNIDEQCKLNYTEIFSHEKLKSEIRIILEGDPGAGKTMLSSQLAYDWSEGKIDGVDILIFLPLKIVENKTLIQAIKEFYIPTNIPLTGNDIENMLSSETERICLLLDGLEEYSTGGRTRAKESSEVIKIMKKEKHSNCKVVITCRSDFAHDLPECPMIKLGRFGETERNSYIEKLSPHNTDKQQKMERIIHDNPFLLDLCSVPLLFVLAVHNIERISLSEEGQLNKVSPFMRSMILKLCSSSNVTHEVDGIQSKLFRSEKMTLGELAFNGLCKGHQQLSWQKDFLEGNIGSLKVWVDSGILVLEEGLVISEKENQDISEKNKGEKIKTKTKKERRQKTPDELPVLSEDMKTAAMSASKAGNEVSKVDEQHQSVSELETEPHVMKENTVRRAAGQVPLTVKFLHKVIQEWFAATFFCSMMRMYTSEEKIQNYVSSELQHISPTDLHYVLRFTSYLHPPSCHIIMNYLLRSYCKDGSVPPYIMNCVFLCFNEHNDIKGPDMKNAVKDVCKEVITIQSEDSRLLQQAKSALLEYASNSGVIIENLELKDVIFAVNKTTLTLNSSVQLGILHTVKMIEVSRWDQVLKEDDYKNILKLLSAGTLLKKVCCIFPSKPPHPLGEITLRNFVSKDIKVEWHIGHFVQSLDPRKGKWMINFKQAGTSSAEISEVSANQGSAKDEEEEQVPTASSLPSTSIESSKYSHTQGTVKRIGSSSTNEIAVPEKKAKYIKEQSTITEASQPVKTEPEVQVFSCRCPEVYISQHQLSPLHVEKIIDHLGGKLDIPQSGISLEIPPDAIEKAVKISFSVVSDPDISLPVDDGLPVVTPVVRCDPCGLHFNKKVTMILPHCAVIDDESTETSVICYSGCYESGSSTSWRKHSEKVESSLQTSLKVLIDHFCYFFCKTKGSNAKAVRVVPFSKKTKDKLLLNLWVCNDIKSVFDDLSQSEKSLKFQLQATWESFIVYEKFEHIKVKLEKISEHEETINLSRIWSGQQVKASFTIERISEVDSIELKIKQALNDDDVTKFHFELQEDNSNGNEQGQQGEARADSMTTEFQYLSKKLLSKEWESVGRKLGLEDAELDHIKEENTGIQQRIYKMLVGWKNKHGIKATHAKLIQCLKQAERQDLADDILNRKDQEGTGLPGRDSGEKPKMRPGAET